MHVAKIVVGIVMMTWTSGAMAILVEDYKAIRILEPSDPRPVPMDPEGCRPMSGQECVAVGPAYPAGISDAGDVFGHMETNHPLKHEWEQAIRWLRKDNYKGDFVGTIELEPKEWDFCAIDGRTRGGHSFWVSPDGIATGRFLPGAPHIDIVSGEVTMLGNGLAEKASGNMTIVNLADGETNCSTDPYGFAVADASLVERPFKQDKHGEVYRLESTVHPKALNNHNVIVGSKDPSCMILYPGHSGLCFGESKAIKIEPAGENVWADSVYMDALSETVNDSSAFDLSNTDPAFAVGVSQDDDRYEHGVIWNVTSGEIVADLGAFSEVHRINSTGDMVVGTRTVFALPPQRDAVVWWTDDQWETVNALTINEILEAVPGGEYWSEVTFVDNVGSFSSRHRISHSPVAVNKHGQLLLVGKMMPDAPIESLTEWPPEFATGAACITRGLCGIPFILDTLDLAAVLKGDINNDGSVNNLDITPFIAALAAADEAAFLLTFPDGSYTAADVDMSGGPNNLDITPFIGLLTAAVSNATAVPEPTSLVWIALALMMKRRRAGRR